MKNLCIEEEVCISSQEVDPVMKQWFAFFPPTVRKKLREALIPWINLAMFNHWCGLNWKAPHNHTNWHCCTDPRSSVVLLRLLFIETKAGLSNRINKTLLRIQRKLHMEQGRTFDLTCARIILFRDRKLSVLVPDKAHSISICSFML